CASPSHTQTLGGYFDLW
nr:immunoglobulin heavy chain junction region [Macaca mulatta]MOW98163.1 immunoglobulin heavy chain junction region [Macaca mulatta]MOW98202.1 immunoglobulin heavy chain junction region [Macaca mulatta]MOW98205.1 immunoglobulin heavy chain junction region [Macaca mulatta]MOW98223.1 immunoglobulin heavy chain junction region [Macaca mulatta]